MLNLVVIGFLAFVVGWFSCLVAVSYGVAQIRRERRRGYITVRGGRPS